MSHGGARAYRFVEPDGTVTKLFVIQGLDLVIEQVRTVSKKRESISTYSNPGTMPYASILKFLVLNRTPLPSSGTRPEARYRNHRPFESDAHFAAMRSVMSPFPLTFAGRLEETVTAQFALEGKEPVLEFSHPHGRVRMSLELAQKIAEYIPKVYEGRPMEFRFIQAFLRRAIRSGKFEPHEKSVPVQRKGNPIRLPPAKAKPAKKLRVRKSSTQHTFGFAKPKKKPGLKRRNH